MALGPAGVAQQHALELAAGHYAAHWDRQGLAPYMRYSRSGGAGFSQENISAISFLSFPPGVCLANDFDYPAWLAEALAGLAASPGHRAALLGDHHRQVQIGIARACRRAVLVQVLVSDYVHWRTPPRIEDGLLILQGDALAPARVTGDLTILVAWEPLPQPQPVDRLVQTGCYGVPRYVAAARRRHQEGDRLQVTSAHCVSPATTDPEYRIPADPGQAAQERQHFLQQAGLGLATYEIPLLARDNWDAYGPRFTLRLVVRDLVEQYGDGIYTVSLWGQIGRAPSLLAEYAVAVAARSELW